MAAVRDGPRVVEASGWREPIDTASVAARTRGAGADLSALARRTLARAGSIRAAIPSAAVGLARRAHRHLRDRRSAVLHRPTHHRGNARRRRRHRAEDGGSATGVVHRRERAHQPADRAPLLPVSAGTADLNEAVAETVGWPELTRQVADVVSALPARERDSVVILTGSYGEAGAIDRFGPALGLPPAFSPHNSYADFRQTRRRQRDRRRRPLHGQRPRSLLRSLPAGGHRRQSPRHRERGARQTDPHMSWAPRRLGRRVETHALPLVTRAPERSVGVARSRQRANEMDVVGLFGKQFRVDRGRRVSGSHREKSVRGPALAGF